MIKATVIAALGALAQETRLDILRLLVQRGTTGMPAGEIGGRLRLPSPTLAFHLNQLRHAALVTSRRESRLIIYTARFRTMNSLIAYLTEQCGGDQPTHTGHDRPVTAPEQGRLLNVLFLCTHNSARSIMAECAMNRWGGGRFRAFSAGSNPRSEVHPITLEVLEKLKYETDGLRSKDWHEFAQSDSPPLDFVFTLCDRAAAEVCPTWPGQPIRTQWVIPAPSSVKGIGAAKREAFARAYVEIEQRVRILAALPIETMQRFALEHWVAEIGKLNLAA